MRMTVGNEELDRQPKSRLQGLLAGALCVLAGAAFVGIASKPTPSSSQQTKATDENGKACDIAFNKSDKCYCMWGGPSGNKDLRLRWLAEHCKPEWLR
ncbi:nitrous oxide reductase [Bradyrhizobium sp. ERR14]|nr:nitrous oxide reductase [Bradyrhizobium sp. ERR14]